jgi:hypothetical protein
VRRDAAGVGEGERRGFDRPGDGAPDVDDGEALLEQVLGLVRVGPDLAV